MLQWIILNAIGMEAIADHEKWIIAYAMERLEEVPGVQIIGPKADYTRRSGFFYAFRDPSS